MEIIVEKAHDSELGPIRAQILVPTAYVQRSLTWFLSLKQDDSSGTGDSGIFYEFLVHISTDGS